jgi:hypothetical protein
MLVASLRDFEVAPAVFRQAVITVFISAAAGLGIAFAIAPHFPRM